MKKKSKIGKQETETKKTERKKSFLTISSKKAAYSVRPFFASASFSSSVDPVALANQLKKVEKMIFHVWMDHMK